MEMIVVTPLGVMGDSKMSSEESPLDVHYTQDKTQELLGDKAD